MKKITSILLLLIASTSFAQVDSNEASNKIYAAHLDGVEIRDPAFERHFNFMKRKVVKMYPYAQYCKELLNEFNQDLMKLDKKRKRNKLGRKTHKQLKEDFKYVVLNMTETDGEVLMKLIHKETGMTVYDILEIYRGTSNAKYWSLFSKAFSQDLHATYDPKEDWIIETIYNRIVSGQYKIKEDVNIISKDDHKEKKKKLRERRKENKKRARQIKREKRKAERNNDD